MILKKTALASAITLALAGGQAIAVTSTVDGQFILDRTSVKAGEFVNLAMVGLNDEGEVDKFGEQQGATIMAVVSSVQGTIQAGGSSGLTPELGSFSTSVKYVALSQGNGEVTIKYDEDAEGTDTITVELQESFPNELGGITFNTIATATKTITIESAGNNVDLLDIIDFSLPTDTTDTQGMLDADITDGIDGAVTVGVPGAQVTVTAYNSSGDKDKTAEGRTVTLKLVDDEGEEAYTFTGKVNSSGDAVITLNSSIEIADAYLMEATIEDFAGDSVDLRDNDTVLAKASPDVKKLYLSSRKATISNAANNASVTGATAGSNAGTWVFVSVLDEYGNVTSTSNNFKVKLVDTNGVIDENALTLSLPGATAGFLGGTAGQIIKIGTSSLVATLEDNSTVETSDPLVIKVVEKGLTAKLHANFTGSVQAGDEFKAFDVVVDGGAVNGVPDGVYGDPTALDASDSYLSTTSTVMTIENSGSAESLDLNLDGNSTELEALFTNADESDAEYRIATTDASYGETFITGYNIRRASANSVKLVNGHGNAVTSVRSIKVGEKYQSDVPSAGIKMTDTYGNVVSAGTVDALGNIVSAGETGTFSIVSNKGTIGVNPDGAELIPGSGINTGGSVAALVTYDTTGETAFSGTDTITLNFTKPGVGALPITTDIPELPTLSSIIVSIEQSTIPVSSEVAVRVESLDQNDKGINDPNGITMSLDPSADTTAEALTPTVKYTDGTRLSSGEQVDFEGKGNGTGSVTLVVEAGPKVGKFVLKFSNSDDAIIGEREFAVSSALLVGCSTENLSVCTDVPDPSTGATCTTAGGVMSDGVCGIPPVDTCTAANLPACTTVEDCTGVGGIFDDTAAAGAQCTATTTPTPTLPVISTVVDGVPVSSIVGPDGTVNPTGATAEFAGGISTDGGATFSNEVEVTNADRVVIKANITVPEAHQGKKADILVAARTPIRREDGTVRAYTYYVIVPGNPKAYLWAGKSFASNDDPSGAIRDGIDPFISDVTLEAEMPIDMWEGTIPTGEYQAFVGYRLSEDGEDGTVAGSVIFNPQPMKMTITK